MSDSLGQEAATSADPDELRAFQARLADANIHTDTFLATDYLNHFNEIVMLLDMIPDMPECIEDAKAWQPKSYEEHFRDSTFSDKDLAITAYRRAPEKYRKPFDETVGQMDRLVATGIVRIENAIASGSPEQIDLTAKSVSRGLQKLMDVAAAIIHGSESTMLQDEIDLLLEG